MPQCPGKVRPSCSWPLQCPVVTDWCYVTGRLLFLPPQQQYHFDFNLAEKPYESYSGLNVRLRYFVRVTISTRGKNVTRETDFVVQNIQQVFYRDARHASAVSSGWFG